MQKSTTNLLFPFYLFKGGFILLFLEKPFKAGLRVRIFENWMQLLKYHLVYILHFIDEEFYSHILYSCNFLYH